MFWIIAALLLLLLFTFFSSLVDVLAFSSLAFPAQIKREVIYGIAFFITITFPLLLLVFWKPLMSLELIVTYGAATGISAGIIHLKQRRLANHKVKYLSIFGNLLLVGIVVGMLVGYGIFRLAATLYLKGLEWTD